MAKSHVYYREIAYHAVGLFEDVYNSGILVCKANSGIGPKPSIKSTPPLDLADRDKTERQRLTTAQLPPRRQPEPDS